MKTKLFLFLLGGLFLMSNVFAHPSACAANFKVVDDEVTFYPNDIPYEVLTNGTTEDSRSGSWGLPFYATVDRSIPSIELVFKEGIGDMECRILREGVVVYSLQESVLCPMSKMIALPHVGGSYTIEVYGANGAYAYGYFEL